MPSSKDQISIIARTAFGTAHVAMTDGSTLVLTEDDIEMIKLAFPTECEMCGYDPDDEGGEDQGYEECDCDEDECCEVCDPDGDEGDDEDAS